MIMSLLSLLLLLTSSSRVWSVGGGGDDGSAHVVTTNFDNDDDGEDAAVGMNRGEDNEDGTADIHNILSCLLILPSNTDWDLGAAVGDKVCLSSRSQKRDEKSERFREEVGYFMKGIVILGLNTTVVANLLDEHPMFICSYVIHTIDIVYVN